MERNGQSSLGIASLTISIISAIGIFLVLLIGATITAAFEEPESAEAMILGLFILGFAGLEFLALGLGLAGVFQKSKSRILAFIGSSISTAILVILFSLILIGVFI
tara:strand:- start:1945 stop:2262 length:318 start_codon:yes stop_codon:yes gene_type:complete